MSAHYWEIILNKQHNLKEKILLLWAQLTQSSPENVIRKKNPLSQQKETNTVERVVNAAVIDEQRIITLEKKEKFC